MPGLYGYGNANVTTNVTNTTGLYIGNGSATILNNAGQLLSLLSNVGTVGFALTTANTQVLASVLDSGVVAGVYGADTIVPQITVGSDGRVTNIVNIPISGALGSYGNANVAAYLPTYTGSLSNSSDIIVLYANAATQATSINLLNANLGAFETYANATFGTSSYGNANVASYLPTDPTIIALQSNAGAQATSINLLNANLGAFETYANATFGTSSYGNSNVAAYLPTNPTITGIQANIGAFETYANLTFATKSALQIVDANLGTATTNITTLFSNAATQSQAIQTLNANLGAFETYANATFGTSSYGNTQAAAWIQIDPTITGIQANLGAYETYGNLTFATKSALQTLDANVGTLGTSLQTLNANVGAFETYANVTFGTSANAASQQTQIDALNANVGAYETYGNLTFATKSALQVVDANLGVATNNITTLFANAATQATNIQTLDANLGTATTNITTLFANAASQQTSIDALNANVGAFETYANSAISTNSTNIQTLNANVGAFETYANVTFSTIANAASQQTAINTLNANVGGHEAFANLTFATKSALQTLNANVGAFETYANATFQTSASTYGNTQVAAYLPVYGGTVLTDRIINTAGISTANVYNDSSLTLNAGTGVAYSTLITLNSGQVLSQGVTSIGGGSVSGYSGFALVVKSSGYANNDGIKVESGFGPNGGTGILVNNSNIIAQGANTYFKGNIITNTGVFWANGNVYSTQSSYGNTEVAAYINQNGINTTQSVLAQGLLYTSSTENITEAASIPTGALRIYGGGSIAKDFKVFGLANIGNVITGNGIFWANGVNYSTTITGTYGNTQVAAYLPLNPTIYTIQANIGAYENYANAAIQTLDANLGTATTNITTLFSNAGSQATSINNINANVGAFETYANATFLNSAYKFNGDLAGNILYDSVNGRIFANAYPLSAPSTSNTAQTAAITNVPVYTGGILQPTTGTNTNQTIGAVLSSNVSLQSSYQTTTNKNSIGTYQYLQAWPSTANNMTNSDRVRASAAQLDVQLNGKQWFSSNASTSTSLVGAQSAAYILGTGAAGHTMGSFNLVLQQPSNGSANIGFATGAYSLVQTSTSGTGYTASNIGVARLFAGAVTQQGNLFIDKAVGLHTVNGWASNANLKYTILNEDSTSTITTNGNIVQAGFAPALTATFSNVAYTGSMSPGFQFTANTSSSLTANVFYLGNVNYASLQQISLDSNISVVTTTSATARQFDFLVYSYGTKTITWPTNSVVYGSIIPNSTTYAKVTQYGGVSTVTVAYTQDPSTLYANVNAQSYTISNPVLNAYAEKQVALGNVSGTVTITNSQGPVQTMTLTGSITINSANMSGFSAGKSVTLILTQGGSGSYTLTSDMKFAGASKTLSTAVGAIDTLTVYYDGTNYLASLVKGYA